MSGAIYKPKGMALEYSDLACNLYEGLCAHSCLYCWAHPQSGEYAPRPRVNILGRLQNEARYYRGQSVLFSFTNDPYQPIEEDLHITRQAIEICGKAGVRPNILTKGGKRVLPDLERLKAANGILGMTIVFTNERDRVHWEPYAAPIRERMDVLRQAHKQGIPTWISLEPVIRTEQALAMIDQTVEFCDEYKVGKVNHMPNLECTIDWRAFEVAVKAKLRASGKRYLIKASLAAFGDGQNLRFPDVRPDTPRAADNRPHGQPTMF